MKIGNDLVIFEVRVKQYLRSILDISGRPDKSAIELLWSDVILQKWEWDYCD